MMPHLDAAHNLARWLMQNEDDATEAVQEAMLRAYKYFDSFHGNHSKAWLLKIVRNTCITRHAATRDIGEEFEEEVHSVEGAASASEAPDDPEQLAIAAANRELVQRSIEALPREFREVLVLREIEGLSYKEIAEIVAIPIGTVMSRLSRGRRMLQRELVTRLGQGRST